MLYYGGEVYSSVAKPLLRLLDSFYHAVIRLVIGAFRNLHVGSFLCYAGESPLDLFLTELFMWAYAHIQRFTNSPKAAGVFFFFQPTKKVHMSKGSASQIFLGLEQRYSFESFSVTLKLVDLLVLFCFILLEPL